MASRTAKDYLHDCSVLKVGLGKIPLAALEAKHVAKYRDERAEAAPSHVRNEMACLSAALSYAVEAGYVSRNVAKDVRRPRKAVRERLITDDEYLAVRAAAVESVKLAMVLAARTLGLPADVLRMGPRNIVRHTTEAARCATVAERPTSKSRSRLWRPRGCAHPVPAESFASPYLRPQGGREAVHGRRYRRNVQALLR